MQAIVTSSNLVILALCVAGVAKDWSQSAFQLFLNSKLPQLWPFLFVYPAFLLVMPLLPRPRKMATKPAAAPSTVQARLMAVATALIDYATVGGLLVFLDIVCRLEDGGLCPFTAACTFLGGGAVMIVKDEIQCRFLWRKFISPYKLNSWPYSWRSSLDQLCIPSAFGFFSVLIVCLSGQVSFDTVSLPRVWIQIWLEGIAASAIIDFILHFAHRWMHERAYFLHKKHHCGRANVVAYHNASIDLIDMVLEFGAGIPLLGLFKTWLGLDYRVHFLTYVFKLFMGFQLHSGNPFAGFFFNPILDYLARSTLCHNLHHAIQKDYNMFVPYSHFGSTKKRHKDIHKYNEVMKTNFPLSM